VDQVGECASAYQWIRMPQIIGDAIQPPGDVQVAALVQRLGMAFGELRPH
jgi:hypothetical protein